MNDNNESFFADIDNLVTINSFARICDVSTTFIYKLEQMGRLTFVLVDGVRFVDKEKYKGLSEIKSTKKLIKKVKSKIKSSKNE